MEPLRGTGELSSASADAWELFATEHVDHSIPSDAAREEDPAWVVADDFTDDRAVGTVWVRLHGGEDLVGHL